MSTRELPRMVESRLAICSKVLDLQEMELAIFILQEVTDEHVHGSLVLRINIHLGENFVDRVDGFNRVRVRAGHTLDLDNIFILRVSINCEKALQHALLKPIMQLCIELSHNLGGPRRFFSFPAVHISNIIKTLS